MTTYERKQIREADPKRVLELYLKPLQATQTAIRDYRMHERLGETSIGFLGHPAVDPKIDFATWAKRYSETLDDTDIAKPCAKIIGVVPPAIRGLQTMQRKGKNIWNTRSLAELNETIRFTIDNHSAITPDALTGMFKSSALNYGYRSQDINMLMDEIESREQGMRHEIGHDSVMYRLTGGFERLETTIDDDLNGIDSRWLCPNGTVVTFDVKATARNAEKANGTRNALYRRAHRQTPKNHLIVHSGFHDDDFRVNHWRPSEDAIIRELPHIEKIVYDAAGMELPLIPSEVK